VKYLCIYFHVCVCVFVCLSMRMLAKYGVRSEDNTISKVPEYELDD
jgi:hypothetical protein